MDSIRIPAHFDRTHIILDEPFELKPDAKLFVTLLSDPQAGEHEAWAQMGKAGLGHAYGADEVESLWVHSPQLAANV